MSSLERRTVVYCGACGMPPEYCPYGPDYETHCNPWLLKHHPALYNKKNHDNSSKSAAGTKSSSSSSSPQDDETNSGSNSRKTQDPTNTPLAVSKPTRPWTTEERLVAFYQKYQPDKVDSVSNILEKYTGKELQLFQALIQKYGPEPFDPFYAQDEDDEEEDDEEEEEEEDDDDETKQVDISKLSIQQQDSTTTATRRGVAAKSTLKMETRVIIQKISRNKKKATTSVIGMDTVPDIKLKDVSKAFSKKFAGSSSVKDLTNGKKEIILQGDHMEEVAIMVVEQFHVKPEVVFLDIDGEFISFMDH